MPTNYDASFLSMDTTEKKASAVVPPKKPECECNLEENDEHFCRDCGYEISEKKCLEGKGNAFCERCDWLNS